MAESLERTEADTQNEAPEAREEADTRPQRPATREDAITLMASARRLADAESVDDVIDATLSYASARLPRTLVFVTRGSHAVAWSGNGWNLGSAAWRQITLPLNGGTPSIFTLVRDGVPHFLGPVAGQPWAPAFYAALGSAPGRTALLVPIRLKGRVAAWLVGRLDRWRLGR